jgi:hypothetical protein
MAADWSSPPVGIPMKSFSAARATLMMSSGVRSNWLMLLSAAATAHSTAAEEERPAPVGTVLSMKISQPLDQGHDPALVFGLQAALTATEWSR